MEWLITLTTFREQLHFQSRWRDRSYADFLTSLGGSGADTFELFTVPSLPNQNTRPLGTGLSRESFQSKRIQECKPTELPALRNSIPAGIASSEYTVTTIWNTCVAMLFWNETHNTKVTALPLSGFRFSEFCFDFKEGKSGHRYILSGKGTPGVSF